MLKKVKEFVNEKYRGKDPAHFERAVYWVQQLKPDADEELLIAAYSHDIERAFREKSAVNEEGFDRGEILKRHQDRGGRIMYDFLVANDYPKNCAAKVRDLIVRHESGGNDEQNILKDADSISWLENNALGHIKVPKYSKEEIRRKIDTTFSRISLEKAKLIAEPFYRKAIELLELS